MGEKQIPISRRCALKQTLDAIYEKGEFHLVKSRGLPIPEGQHVQLVVEVPDNSEDVMTLVTHVYDGLPEKEIKKIEQISLDRRNFFDNGERG